MKKNNQIGQGIGALLSPNKSSDNLEQNSILISKISPNPNQPRKLFDEKALKQLAQSIDEKGLISPITVKASNNKYIIVAGERPILLNNALGPAWVVHNVNWVDTDEDELFAIENTDVSQVALVHEEFKALLPGANYFSIAQISHPFSLC